MQEWMITVKNIMQHHKSAITAKDTTEVIEHNLINSITINKARIDSNIKVRELKKKSINKSEDCKK